MDHCITHVSKVDVCVGGGRVGNYLIFVSLIYAYCRISTTVFIASPFKITALCIHRRNSKTTES